MAGQAGWAATQNTDALICGELVALPAADDDTTALRRELEVARGRCAQIEHVLFVGEGNAPAVIATASKNGNWTLVTDVSEKIGRRLVVYLKRAGLRVGSEASGDAPSASANADSDAAPSMSSRTSATKRGAADNTNPDDCRALGRRCLAKEAVKILAQLDAMGKSYRARRLVADLSVLLKETGGDPDTIFPVLKKLDSGYQLEALAEIAFFGGGAKARAELEARLKKLERNGGWQADMAQTAVAIVEAAAGAQGGLSWTDLTPSARLAPAMMHAARHLGRRDAVGGADAAEAALALRDSDDQVEYEALRQAFAMIRELAAGGHVDAAERVARALPKPLHAIVGQAMLAAADPKWLEISLRKARSAGRDRNYPLREVAVMAAKSGRPDLALSAISAMSDKSTRQDQAIALAAIGAETGDAGMVAQAQAALSSIPARATAALADAQLAIANAFARLGEKKRAWTSAQTIRSPEHRMEAYIRLAGVSSQRFP